MNEKNKINDFAKWDSLGNFNVLLACEKKFKFNFTNKEFNTINTFKEILKIVNKRKNLKKKINTLFLKLKIKKGSKIIFIPTLQVFYNLSIKKKV